MKILGVSALYHDSAAALVIDGKIVAAAQEERFTRKKNDAGIPVHSIRYCLAEGEKISSEPLEYIVFHSQPLLILDRYIKNILALGGNSRSLIDFGFQKIFSQTLWINELLKEVVSEFTPP